MSGKVFNLYSWSAAVLLLCLFGYIQMSNAGELCQYHRDHSSGLSVKWCPDICCSNDQPRRENTTCCNSPVVYITSTISAFTIFGYSWWILFICSICLFTAISILFHFTKRIHMLKHFKHFNSAVDPVTAFTISKSQFNINLNDAGIITEQNPPSYSNSVSPPPSYISVNPSTMKIVE